MADYKESTISGTSWQRACRVVIENPYGGTPTINFVEEQAINIDGNVITKPVANVGCEFNEADTRHLDLYMKLNELYMELAAKRDGTYVAPVAEPPVE